MLEGAVKPLNAGDTGHCKAFYEIEYMFGKCRLVRINSRERRETISGLGSKRETFYIIDAIRTVQLCHALENVTF
jgi:hypothetical protein